jgi:hypothetical protein
MTIVGGTTGGAEPTKILKAFIFWDKTVCSQMNVKRRLGGSKIELRKKAASTAYSYSRTLKIKMRLQKRRREL